MTGRPEKARGAGSLRATEKVLGAMAAGAEREMDRLGRDFENLAREASAILDAAGAIVGCAESERMGSVLPGVRRLGNAAKDFIRGRLTATAGILETVIAEEKLLRQLEELTRGQKAIVRETEMLRVLTHIEVARLGDVGAGFQYLAHELNDFSQSVARSTQELTRHTEERRKAIEETRRALAVQLPQMREEFARIELSLDGELGAVEGTLGQLLETPLRFRACVEEVAGQIAGVVAAIQAHDITRQQMDHVQSALGTIAAGLEAGSNQAQARAGLAIQSYQLQNAQQTVAGWLKQIRTCLEGIRRIASSEILDLGRVVMGQQRVLSAQLVRMEQLEAACETGDARVQASFAGIAGLMALVSEHLERSRSVRDRLQLLMFNSIVEANHLGSQADGILEISTTIKRIAATWGEITARSEAATAEIGRLVEASRGTVEAFSEDSYQDLRASRTRTAGGLAILRDAAGCAQTRGREIETAVGALQASLAEIAGAGDRLESGFGRLPAALVTIDRERQALEEGGGFDAEAMERRFSAEYTTEMERAVLRAALAGGPVPAAQQNFAGNSVELF